MSVNHSARSGGEIGIFSMFFDMKVCCVFSLKLHQGDFKKYTQYIIINTKRKSRLIIPNIIISAAMGFLSWGLQNKFETAVFSPNDGLKSFA